MHPNYVFVVSSTQKWAKEEPRLFFVTTKMTEYFKELIYFIDAYGYSNNPVIGF